MFSCNVPLPGTVDRLANELHPRLAPFDRVRERYNLVCKRFTAEDVTTPGGPEPDRNRLVAELREEVRPVLAGTGPFDLRITGVGCFERPVRGPGPIVYLAVESDGLLRVHRRLCDAFGTIADLEGAEYVPHVTLARGGSPDAVQRLLETDVDPIEWTAHSLGIYDPEWREVAGEIRL